MNELFKSLDGRQTLGTAVEVQLRTLADLSLTSSGPGPLQIPVSCYVHRGMQQVVIQVTEFLPHMWETQIEFLAPRFAWPSLACLLWGIYGVYHRGWEDLSLCLSLSLSLWFSNK